MPWLYQHRDQLNEEQARFAEIAHFFASKVPPGDRDDLEQEIVIEMMEAAANGLENARDKKKYLLGVARNVFLEYWLRRYQQRRKFLYLREARKGEMVARTNAFVSGKDRDEEWTLTSDDGDKDARLDASALLSTLPKRLVEIGYKRLNGEKLNEADKSYWQRHKAKLNCRKHANHLADEEKRRIVQFYREGMSLYKIARILNRSKSPIRLCLAQAGLRQAPAWMSHQLVTITESR